MKNFSLVQKMTNRMTNSISTAKRAILIAICIIGCFFLLYASSITQDTQLAQAQGNPIVIENLLTGDTSWVLTNQSFDVQLHIKGYASKTSVNVGETIDFKLDVSVAADVEAEIYRMGWYNGDGGRLITTLPTLSVTPQPAPVVEIATGKITAPWAVAHTLSVPTDWVSGIYLVKLTRVDNGKQNYIKFVVRDDSRTADFLYQHGDTTDQAYNRFPVDNATGKSLYSGWGPNTNRGDKIAWKVSFDRPYEEAGAGKFFNWEYPLVRWLEKNGYDIAYVSDLDTHQIGTSANNLNLLNYKGFLSTGHDEYWSTDMLTNVTAARDAGVNLAFFGANAVYWRVKFEDGDRTMVAAKNKASTLEASLPAAERTTRFRDLGLAEQHLIGVQYETFNANALKDPTLYTDYVVKNSSHWVYHNTGFADNDTVAGLVGYEIDNDHGVTPSSVVTNTYLFLSESPFTDTVGITTTANSSIYQATSDAWVFATGTMNWSWGLDKSGYVDAGIEQTTANLLNTFRSGILPTASGACGAIHEAEDGTIAAGPNGFETEIDPAASGGSFIHAPESAGNEFTGFVVSKRVDYCFTVTQPGMYRIRAEVYGLDDLSDSFYAQVNGAPSAGYLWDIKPYNFGSVFNSEYETDYINNRDVAFGEVVEIALGVGDHTVSVYVREDGTRLDAIALELIDAVPDIVIQETPDSTTEPASPTFSWQSDSQATDYRLVVYNVAGDTVDWDQVYSAVEANCAGGGICSVQPTALSLIPGSYTWLVQGQHIVVPSSLSYGNGLWSIY